MAGYKETPRQKMIAMMYLVLTALLALNVSKEILDAFLVVNQSMEETSETFANKLSNVYIQFDNQYQLNQNKVKPYWERALEAQKLSNELKHYIEQQIFEVVKKSERMDSTEIISEYYFTETRPDPYNPRGTREVLLLDVAKVPSKDKYDEATNYFINKGEATKLKDKINQYKQDMLALVDEQYRSKVNIGLETDGEYFDASGTPQNWEMHNFYHTILAATVTIMNKLKAEVQTAEFDVVSQLYSEITITDFKFDKIEAKVIPRTSYVLKGDKYEAEVLVAAYDTKQAPAVYIMQGANELSIQNKDRADRLSGEGGTVKLEFPAVREGLQKYAGLIEVTDPEGAVLSFPFSHEYIVAPPSLTVAATKMNVFYIGVDNPVSISVPGIADANIVANISTGTLGRAPNGDGWIVRVPTGSTKATISVSAKYEGDQRSMGSAEFRVKKVPAPVAEIAGQSDGVIEKNTLVAAGAIIPVMKDFDFELFFKVVSFKMTYVVGGDLQSKRASGNRFSDEMKNIIQNAKKGQKFYFENIQAEGPDGTTRSLNPISLEIK